MDKRKKEFAGNEVGYAVSLSPQQVVFGPSIQIDQNQLGLLAASGSSIDKFQDAPVAQNCLIVPRL